MGTTSEKLTYLNTTKEKIRNSINLTGANLTSEDTFRSYATKLNKGYIDIINNGIDNLYNNFPKVSGIGSNLSLTPTYEAPMKLNEIQGNTLQENTPTPDTPVPIECVTGLQNINVCGKNLLPFTNQDFTFKDMHYYVQNGNIYLNGTNAGETGSNNALFKENFSFYLEAGTYTLQDKNLVSGNRDIRKYSDNTVLGRLNPNSKVVSFTLTERTQVYLGFYIYNQTYNNELIEVQLEQGSATSYEPYKGNTYEVNLGKNLCNNALFVAGSGATINSYTDNSISVTFVGTYKAATQFIDISNSIYTFSIGNISNNKGRMEVYLYNNGEQVGTKQNVTANQTYIIDNTSGLGDQIRLTLSNSDLTQTNEITFNNIQLEKGSQATSYSPYFTPIELNKIGDYQDSIKKSTGKNLFDKDTITSGYRLDPSGESYPDTNCFLSEYIPVEPNTIYTRNVTASAYECIGFYTSDKTFISRNTSDSTTTTPSNSYYVRITGYNTNLNTMQLEKGNQATSYEPYGKVWYEEKQIGKVVLDGSTGSYSNPSTNRFNIDNLITDFKKSEGYNLSLSNYYKSFNQVGTNADFNTLVSNENYAFDFSSATSYTLRFKDTRYTNVNDFKAWLGTNNVSIIYVLNTPTYTEITNTELINQLEALNTAKSQEGTTNISITSEDLEMILNVSALKGEE